ncbi:uncharacterized protein LOC110457477 [Mizuhopecten yessoensis]|uniref:uncharacterized protein LOC110457477 n=1 Tax=Mizuhopecten yessoensis TaxID=6573 RepID=UPI000B45A3A2|nr:uncharacterized protein LOC110457477 [Mizuhopecten yessoensis]
MRPKIVVFLCALASLGSTAQGAATTVSPGCGTVPADIVFLLDSSGSVGSANFQKQKDFVAKFANSFDIGPRNVQIGVTTFSTAVHNQFNLNKYSAKAPLVHAINAIPYNAGSTHTDIAIDYVTGHSFTPAAGDRDHVANILIVMTDGQSNNKPATLAAATKLHAKNIKVFGIGIGSGIDRSELSHIATDAKHVFTVSNFGALTTLQAELKKTACEIDGQWSSYGFWSPCTKTCGGGTHYRERTCSNPPPANGGKQCVGAHRETAACHAQACPTIPPTTTTQKPATTHAPTTPIPGCGVVPADIVFILDSSGSVGTANFQKMLQFVRTTAQGFDIGPNGVEVSVITFSDKPHLEFHLNKYHDKNSVLNAISNVHYITGGTNTADALKYARETSFTAANGVRPNSAKIAIVITDGKSNSAGATANEANLLRNDGVTVFSVGVGAGPKTSELNSMATDPDNQHVFVVNNFDALTQIKSTLQQKACEVKATVAPAPHANTGCGAKADIVFLLDSSGSVGSSNFNKMLHFVQNVSDTFTIGPNDVQVGVDTFSTGHKAEFNMGSHLTKPSLLSAIGNIKYHSGSTHTGQAINFMHTSSYTAAAGHRPNVPKIGIVVTDGNSNNRQLTIQEAAAARKAGITMLAIGVGHGINSAELNAIASDPDSQYAFRADNFDALGSLKTLLSTKACEVSQPHPNATAPQDCGAVADIIFNLDSSGSVGKANFDKMLEFVKTMVKNFNVASDKIRIGLSIFSSRQYNIFNLNRYTNKASLLAAIDKVPYKSGGTNTGTALKEVYSKMFTQPNGDRPGIPNIEIVITDGRSNNHPDTVKEAANTQHKGISVFAVGVGAGVSKSELNDIASDPDSAHVMTVTDFSKLSQIQSAFQSKACAVIPPTAPAYIPTAVPTLSPPLDPCMDQLANCKTYGQRSCSGQYTQWAQTNCARYCGFCATSVPTIPPDCVDKLANCKEYDATVCSTYGPWATDNCRQFCGFCQFNAKGVNGYYGRCSYGGKTYGQGESWSDGCAYDCTCDDASKGHYSCYNKCPSYYNLPPQCTLTQKKGQCCLEPVCNFNPTYQTTTGQTVGNVNGINTCKYNGHDYYQGQTWNVGCDLNCQCVDAGAGMYSCQSRCPTYKDLPSMCHLHKQPGKCCQEPVCDYNQQYGTFTGTGAISGQGVGATPTAAPQCVDVATNCALYQANMCTDAGFHAFAKANCAKFCNLCSELSAPSPTDRCIFKGVAYQQGQTWFDGCDFECMCENAKYGYYRCNKRCPDFVNLPLGCHMVKKAGECCSKIQCDGGQGGSFIGSSTVPNVVGSYPVPNIAPTLAPQPGSGGVPVPGGATPLPGQTLAPNPNGGGGTPGLVPSLVPKQIDGCYVNGTLYQQGLRWQDGCDFTCVCDDGKTGRFRCQPKCPDFKNLPAQCTLMEDPTDPCCKVPSCPAGSNAQIPVPSYGPGFSGYGQAQLPPQIATGGYGPGPSSNGTSGGPSSFTGSNPGPTVSGSRNGCVYKGQVHQQGQSWDDGCDFRCTCMDAVQGKYRCLDRCQLYQNIPITCTMVQDPKDHCCKIPQCSGAAATTPAPFYARTTPPTGGDYCVYKGSYYHQGEEWNDGCSYKCRCEDAKNHYHQCTDRCGRYDNVPLGCTYQPDTKDPQCCRVPVCNIAGTQGGISGGSGTAPTGFTGSFTGYGKPQGSNPNNTVTGYTRACIYKGQIHQQGETWHDGCNYDCECTDATKGMYRCTDRCPRYGSLPATCHLTNDPNNRCCQKAECAPTATTQCKDNRADCASFGQYSCHAPYADWARDNCANYCGFCSGSSGTQAPSAATVCEDKIPNCQDYGTDTCTGQYTGWASFNCPKFCNLCGGSATPNPVINPTPGTGSGTCSDVLPNCAEFTRDSCSDPYLQWAKTNCPHYCGLCGQTGSGTGTNPGGMSGTGTLPGGTGTGTNPGGISGSGTPAPPGGTGTGSQGGFSGTGTMAPGGTGTGTQGGFGGTGTMAPVGTGTGTQGGISGSGTPAPPGGTGTGSQGGFSGSGTMAPGGTGTGTQGGGFSGTGVNPGGSASGTQGGFNGQGYVTVLPGQAFTGSNSGCYYKGQLYQTGQSWQDGCDYNCTCADGMRGYYVCNALCTQWTNLPAGCVLQKPQGECCSSPKCSGSGSASGTGTVNTGSSSGCYYKGQMYTQGQSFDDGCTYKCQCTDANTGYYTCKNKCVQWNLPAACSLNPPAQGKCCKTPNCPQGYVLNYPPGYIEE